MKKDISRPFIRLTAAVFLTAFLFPAFVTAQEVQAPAQRGKTPAEKMRPRQALGLTPEQEQALEEFRKARMEEDRSFREEMTKIHADMRELAKDPKANQGKLDALIDKTAQLRAGREKAAFRNRAERDKIFTPEQLERMKSFRGRLRGRPGLARRGRMGFGGIGFRGPAMGRFRGTGIGMRPMERLRALRHRLLLRRRR